MSDLSGVSCRFFNGDVWFYQFWIFPTFTWKMLDPHISQTCSATYTSIRRCISHLLTVPRLRITTCLHVCVYTGVGHVWRVLCQPPRPEAYSDRLRLRGSPLQEGLPSVGLCWGEFSEERVLSALFSFILVWFICFCQQINVVVLAGWQRDRQSVSSHLQLCWILWFLVIFAIFFFFELITINPGFPQALKVLDIWGCERIIYSLNWIHSLQRNGSIININTLSENYLIYFAGSKNEDTTFWLKENFYKNPSYDQDVLTAKNVTNLNNQHLTVFCV